MSEPKTNTVEVGNITPPAREFLIDLLAKALAVGQEPHPNMRPVAYAKIRAFLETNPEELLDSAMTLSEALDRSLSPLRFICSTSGGRKGRPAVIPEGDELRRGLVAAGWSQAANHTAVVSLLDQVLPEWRKHYESHESTPEHRLYDIPNCMVPQLLERHRENCGQRRKGKSKDPGESEKAEP